MPHRLVPNTEKKAGREIRESTRTHMMELVLIGLALLPRTVLQPYDASERTTPTSVSRLIAEPTNESKLQVSSDSQQLLTVKAMWREPPANYGSFFNLQLYGLIAVSPHFAAGHAQMCGNYWLRLYNACPMGGIGHCGSWASTTEKMVQCGNGTLQWMSQADQEQVVRDFCSCISCAFLPAVKDTNEPPWMANDQCMVGTPSLESVIEQLADELCESVVATGPDSCPGASSADLESSGGCFAKDSTEACRVLDASGSAEQAYSACYAAPTASGGTDAAEVVRMAELTSGDIVLTTDEDGCLAKTRVLFNVRPFQLVSWPHCCMCPRRLCPTAAQRPSGVSRLQVL